MNKHCSKAGVQMADRDMKKCPAHFAMSGMQLEATLSFHLTSKRMTITEKKVLARLWGEKNPSAFLAPSLFKSE